MALHTDDILVGTFFQLWSVNNNLPDCKPNINDCLQLFIVVGRFLPMRPFGKLVFCPSCPSWLQLLEPETCICQLCPLALAAMAYLRTELEVGENESSPKDAPGPFELRPPKAMRLDHLSSRPSLTLPCAAMQHDQPSRSGQAKRSNILEGVAAADDQPGLRGTHS